MSTFLTFVHQAQQVADTFSLSDFPDWMVAALVAYEAGTLTKKQSKKVKRKLVWEVFKNKFNFKKKKDKIENKGVLIVLLIICIGLTGLIFALGGTVWGIVAAVCTLLLGSMLFAK